MRASPPLTCRTIFDLAVLAGLALFVSEVVAAPWNKCVVDGAVVYQQAPCPAGEVRKPPTVAELNAETQRRRAAVAATPDKAGPAATVTSAAFRCDGRKYCTQMKSCDEAKYFLANCPAVQMDGDKDGIPCEQQWCVR